MAAKKSLGQKIIDIVRGKYERKTKEKYFQFINFLEKFELFNDAKLLEKMKKNFESKRLMFLKDDIKNIEQIASQIDATKIRCVKGPLREYQLKLAAFMKTLIKDLEQVGFKPCITGGSLLGAYRHKGFIPWDDDADFEVMRDEYYKIIEYAKQKYIYYDAYNCLFFPEHDAIIDVMLKQNPNKIVFSRKPSCLSAYLGTSMEDCLTIDFFARDCIKDGISEDDYKKYREDKYPEHRRSIKKNWKTRFDFIEKELANPDIYVKESDNYVFAWDHIDFYAYGLTYFLKKEDILPYKKITFEGTEYYAVNNIEKYLEKLYGKNYMSIPVNLEVAKYVKSYSKWLNKRGRNYFIDQDDLLQ